MNALKAALHELLGLFVEDGAFASMIVAVIILAVLIAKLLPQLAWAAGGVLLLGSLAALLLSVIGAAAKARR